MEKVIKYGSVLFDVKTLKDVTHRVTGINFIQHNMIKVTIQKGLQVTQISISIEEAEQIGFINFNALKGYCK